MSKKETLKERILRRGIKRFKNKHFKWVLIDKLRDKKWKTKG
jgi:hypothetical protein